MNMPKKESRWSALEWSVAILNAKHYGSCNYATPDAGPCCVVGQAVALAGGDPTHLLEGATSSHWRNKDYLLNFFDEEEIETLRSMQRIWDRGEGTEDEARDAMFNGVLVRMGFIKGD